MARGTTRRTALLAFAALAARPDSARSADAGLRVGVRYDAPPFGWVDPRTGEVTGFDVEIARSLGRRLFGPRAPTLFSPVDPKNRIPLLESGEIDLFVASTTITPERLALVAFSNVYYRSGQSLLVRRGSPVKSYRDLAERSVCTAVGSTSEQVIRRLAPRARVHALGSYLECDDALQAGQTDVLTTDGDILRGFQQQHPTTLRLVGGLFTFEPYGIGIAKGNDGLVRRVDDALGAMFRDGEYAKIYRAQLGVPLPVDVGQWFGMDPNAAAALYQRDLPSGG